MCQCMSKYSYTVRNDTHLNLNKRGKLSIQSEKLHYKRSKDWKIGHNMNLHRRQNPHILGMFPVWTMYLEVYSTTYYECRRKTWPQHIHFLRSRRSYFTDACIDVALIVFRLENSHFWFHRFTNAFHYVTGSLLMNRDHRRYCHRWSFICIFRL
jgi:hypothetical protein